MKYMWICYSISFLFFSFVIYMACTQDTKDKNLVKTSQGQTSKIDYQGHTYVVWSINCGGGIVHDPDCTCGIEEKNKK